MKGLVRFNLQLECDDTSRVLTYGCVQFLWNDTTDISKEVWHNFLKVNWLDWVWTARDESTKQQGWSDSW